MPQYVSVISMTYDGSSLTISDVKLYIILQGSTDVLSEMVMYKFRGEFLMHAPYIMANTKSIPDVMNLGAPNIRYDHT